MLHKNPVSRSSHRFRFEMVLLPSSVMAGQNMSSHLYLADDVLELEDKGGKRSSMAFIGEYHIGEIHFLILPHPFQSCRLLPFVKGGLVLDFLMVAISRNTLQKVARDNFGILQTLQICLVEASWVFTVSCVLCVLKHVSYVSAD